MKRRRVIFVLAGMVLAVVVTFVVRPGEQEPKYQGKKLSEWLETKDHDARKVAVRAIGTNALPWLLRWIRCDLPPWKTNLRRFIAKLPLPVRERLASKSLKNMEGVKHAMFANIGFQILAQDASPAIPQLAKLANDPKSPNGARFAISILTDRLCVEAIPELLAILKNQRAPQRMAVIDHFRYGVRASDLGTNASATVEILLRCLNERPYQVRSAAARTLGNLALEPEVVVAALAKRAEDPEWMVRARSVEALGKYTEQARPVLGLLSRALNDSDLQVRMEATNALQNIAPEVLATNSFNEL